jgi:hypothetical protein
MTEPTVSAQTRPETVEEQLKKLFARTSELGDRVAALIDPKWGAKAGLLPRDHPLYPDARQADRPEVEVADTAPDAAEDPTTAPERQAAYDAVYAYIRLLGEEMPASRIHRNAIVWQGVNAALDASAGVLADVEDERDGAYRERAHLVALLAAMTPGAVITYATDVDEPGWQIVYLNLGGRQASWHISPRDADLFSHVERVEHEDPRGHWDGHTKEEKYAAIAAHTAELMQQCGPECAEMHQGGFRCVTG